MIFIVNKHLNFITSVKYVTGSPKTSHVRTKTEIHFIAQYYSYTQEVSMHSISTAQCEQVCFSGGHFANPVMSRTREWPLYRAPIGWPSGWLCTVGGMGQLNS